MSEMRTKIAEELVKVTNRWIAPNFPAEHKLREFAELDDRERRLNLDYADAALEVVGRAPSVQQPDVHAALRWAMDEIDILANKVCGWAYPQAMTMGADRKSEQDNYVKAVEARRSTAMSKSAEPVALIEAFKMARTRLERFADEAQAGRVHYDARELKRKIWGAFAEADELLECPKCVGTGSEESHNAYHIDGGFQPCSHCGGSGVTAPSHDAVSIDRNELRRHVIANHVRLTSGGGMVPNGRSCKICMGEWADGATENHALTCPLDGSAPPRKERGVEAS